MIHGSKIQQQLSQWKKEAMNWKEREHGGVIWKGLKRKGKGKYCN